MKRAIVVCAAVLLAGAAFLMLGGTGRPAGACSTSAAPGSDLTILGPSTLTAEQLVHYWELRKGDTQPAKLRDPIAKVIGYYVDAGKAEGVRGDLAFVQSLIETGWFTNGDTARNNFAGVGHYDNAPAGFDYPTPEAGVIAQVQLLKRYAAGNDVDLALTEYGPKAGATATTVAGLSGTWASATNYGDTITSQYLQVLQSAGLTSWAAGTAIDCEDPVVITPGPTGQLVTVGGITVDASIGTQLQNMLTAAAADGYTLTGGGYRDPAEQIALRRSHCGTSYYAIYQMPSSSCRPPTARPGTSQHEMGLAIDFRCNGSSIGQYERSNPCVVWLTEHAAGYGFYPLKSEAWHWSTSGS